MDTNILRCTAFRHGALGAFLWNKNIRFSQKKKCHLTYEIYICDSHVCIQHAGLFRLGVMQVSQWTAATPCGLLADLWSSFHDTTAAIMARWRSSVVENMILVYWLKERCNIVALRENVATVTASRAGGALVDQQASYRWCKGAALMMPWQVETLWNKMIGIIGY